MYLGEFVASGSDDGKWFIWEKQTGRLVKMLTGDDAGNVVLKKNTSFSLFLFSFSFFVHSEIQILCLVVVNCIQAHPFDCAVATSGIDNTIKVCYSFLICFVYTNCYHYLTVTINY
jgi:WD and tetratricopeptide repeats protein 1